MILTVAEGSGVVEALGKVAEPWATIYSHSKVVSAAVTYFHIVPLILSGGLAVATDRATFRVMKSGIDQRAAHIRQFGPVHMTVIIGLVFSLASGVLLLLADVEALLGSIYFWIKLGLVFLLVVNGFAIIRTEKAIDGSGKDAAGWDRMRMHAVFSVFLWLATTLAGVVLKEFA